MTLKKWEPSVSGNTFMLRGNLGDEGTRKLMSVMELPASMTHAVQDASSPGSDNEKQAKLLANTAVLEFAEHLDGRP